MEKKILDSALPLIKAYEGCHLKAYKCPAGVWTIGWGQTGKDIKEGVVWTQEQADAALEKSVAELTKGALELIKVRLRPEQIGALVSFAYNVGLGDLAKSTLLRLVNAKADTEDIVKQFLVWNKAGGKPLMGLLYRRASEALMFKSETFKRFNSLEEMEPYFEIEHELLPPKPVTPTKPKAAATPKTKSSAPKKKV
jgi:lysozyme